MFLGRPSPKQPFGFRVVSIGKRVAHGAGRKCQAGEEVTEQTIERLYKGWKVEVPFGNQLDVNFVLAVRQRVGLDAGSSSYTVISLKDTSNDTTKRYSATILARPPITRLRLEALVRRATADIRKERYHRAEQFGQAFRNRDADVVSLYVAADPTDATNANWVCRTMWISQSLDPAARPLPIGGVDLGDGLEVIWKSDYALSGQFYKLSKSTSRHFSVK